MIISVLLFISPVDLSDNRYFDTKGSRIALNLPKTQMIDKFFPLALTEKIFHFSQETISRLKDRANQKNSKEPLIISSFQALSLQPRDDLDAKVTRVVLRV